MKWRKWNNLIHRDVGYLCVGLTIIYAASGVAVNHTRDWNPNYSVDREERNIGAIPDEIQDTGDVIPYVLMRVGEIDAPKSHFRPDPENIEIYLEDNTLKVNLKSGTVVQERIQSRPVLRPMNFLHLNNARKLWTYFADLYAVCMIILSLTGIFVLRGKKGLKGRGKWLIIAGLLVPLVFIFAYYE